MFEVDQSGQVLHLKDISKPPAPVKPVAPQQEEPEEPVTDIVADGLWHPEFDEALASFLSEDARISLKQMYEEGVEPPFVSDGGWGKRAGRAAEPADEPAEPAPEPAPEPSSKRGRGRGRGRDNRGGGQGRVGGREKRPDNRKVVSEVSLVSCAEGGLSLRLLEHRVKGAAYCAPYCHSKHIQKQARNRDRRGQ